MATGMIGPPPVIPGQLDIHGGEVQPPVFSQAAPSPRDFGEQSPRVFRGDSPRDFAGHAPQVFGDAQIPHVTHEVGPSPWPPPGMTLVPAERIADAIAGMTIVSVDVQDDETALYLQGVECPSITLVITDDGYWTAVVAS